MKASKILISLKNSRQKGATIIEYVLIAALLSIAAIGTLTTLGTSISTKFGTVGTSVTAAGN